MTATLKWFSLATDAEPDVITYTGNFKIEGDVEISGLVRRGNQVFDAITPQWTALANFPGRIYYSPGLNKDPNNIYTTSSTSSVNLASISGVVGPLYIGTNLNYEVGDLVKFIYKEDSTTFFKIIVTGYNKNTGGIAGTLTETSGTGTYNSWNVYLFDPQTRVGVGTLNPSYALDVNGDIRYTGRLFRDTSEVNFGLGAWIASNLVNDNTIFYGGSGTRVGIGNGFGATLSTQTASGTLHIWDELSTGAWDANYGLRLGPADLNKCFMQMGVTTNSHGWIQSARVGSSIGSHTPNSLVINPVGGNVGIGTTGFTEGGLLTLNHADQTQNKYGNNIYRTIELTRRTEELNLVYSNRMGILFDDRIAGTSDPKLHFLADNGTVSWKINNWPSACIMTMSSTGNVGIGTTNPESALHIDSQGSCSIILNNTGLPSGSIAYGISRDSNGLNFGSYTGGNINNNMYLNTSGLTLSGNMDVSGEFRINGTAVLQGTRLGPNVLNSSLRTLGVLSQNLINNAGFVSNLGAGFAHFMLNDTSGSIQFGLGLSGTNNNFAVYSYPGGVERMTVNRTNGFVGIEKTDPQYKLHVGSGSGQTYNTGSVNNYYWWRYDGYYSLSLSGYGGAQNVTNIVARFEGDVWATTFLAQSDIRTKTNITNINNTIRSLRNITPVNFEYITEKGKINSGFLAQEVEQEFPNLVSKSTEFIPNVYKLCAVNAKHDGFYINDTDHDVTINSTIKLILSNKEELKANIIEINDGQYIVDVKIPDDHCEILVYGTEVDDMRCLNIDGMTSVNTAAIKELDRENQELKRRVEALETRLEMLLSRMNVSQ